MKSHILCCHTGSLFAVCFFLIAPAFATDQTVTGDLTVEGSSDFVGGSWFGSGITIESPNTVNAKIFIRKSDSGIPSQSGGTLVFENNHLHDTTRLPGVVSGSIDFNYSQPTSGVSQLGAQIKAISDFPQSGGDTPTALAFGTFNSPYYSGTGAYGFGERMRISSNGNVGIGTSVPSAKLDVAGDTKIQGDLIVEGALIAPNGAVGGGLNGLTLTSGGTNQNLTLAPSGTGKTITAAPLSVTSTVSSSSPTTGALNVAGGAGVMGNLNIGGAVTSSTASLAVANTPVFHVRPFLLSTTAGQPIVIAQGARLAGRYTLQTEYGGPHDLVLDVTGSQFSGGQITILRDFRYDGSQQLFDFRLLITNDGSTIQLVATAASTTQFVCAYEGTYTSLLDLNPVGSTPQTNLASVPAYSLTPNLNVESINVRSGFGLHGNIKNFGTDESWSENIVLIKSSGWGGVRLARNDPSSGNFEGNWAIGYTGGTGNDLSISNLYGGVQRDGLIHISSATQNVGIGTTAPADKLDVNGNARVRGSLRIPPSGDLTMGNFTAGTNPAAQ